MSKTTKVIVWIIVILIAIWAISAVMKSPANTGVNNTESITIGFVGPLTGDLANMGENARAAVSIAVDEVNTAGGVLGKNLSVVYEDDACSGATGANAVSKLINTDNVVAVLGGVCSGATLGEAPITEAAKIPQLSFCSTNPTISQAGDYIFRDVPSDLFQAKYAAGYLMNAGKKNVALLSIKNDWGDGLSKAFSDAFVAAGGKIVLADTFDPDTKDLKAQFTAIKAKNPDAIYFASYTDSGIAGIKQAHDLGINATFFGADAWDDSRLWSELGSIGDGAMYTVVGTNSSDNFKTKMKAKLGKDDLVYCSNYAYDGVKILADAINRAGSTDSTAIKDALYQTDYTGGVSAQEIKFDTNGDPTSATYIVKVAKNGSATEMAQ